METLDKLYKYCSEHNPDCEVSDYNNHVVRVKNIFKYPEKMLKFQSLLGKWESCHCAKPGIQSMKLPYWTGTEIATNVLNLEQKFDEFRTEIEFYYFYYNNTGLDANLHDLRTNNCNLPHTDPGDKRDQINLIGLVNLNKRPVKTGFWEFKGKLTEDTEKFADEYNVYCNTINYDNYHEKINNGILDNVFNVEYGFNEAIFYNSISFHQPIIDKYYTRESPRIMMRLSYILDEGVKEW